MKEVNVNIIDWSAKSVLYSCLPNSADWIYYENGNELTNVVIPESVTTIEQYALYNGTKINSVTIHNSVTKIGKNAFNGCTNLSRVDVHATTPPVLETNDFGSADVYVSSSSLPSYLAANNWKYCNFKTSFSDMSPLEINVKNPGQLASRINQKGYQLNEVFFLKLTGSLNADDWTILSPQNMPYLVWLDLSEADVTEIPANQFKNSQLFYFCPPNTLTKIGSSAFEASNRLMYAIELKQGIEIGNKAFYGAFYPNSVVVSFLGSASIANNAFELSSLYQVIFPTSGNVTIGESAFMNSMLTTLELPSSVRSISKKAFAYTPIAGTVIIPESVGELNAYTFEGCTQLQKLIVEGNSDLLLESFCSGCSQLEEVTFEGIVRNIQDNAFLNNSSLKTIKWPQNLWRVGSNAFAGCTSLQEVALPNTVSSLGQSVFAGDKKLSKVTLPYGLKTIGETVFDGCTALTELEIPETVASWGKYPFKNCGNALKTLSVHWDKPIQVASDFFNGVDCANCELRIPYFTSNAYVQATGWSKFKNSIRESIGIIEVTCGRGGLVQVEGVTVSNQTSNVSFYGGRPVVFTIVPEDGCKIGTVTLDGKDITSQLVDGKYTLEELDDNYSFAVSFELPAANPELAFLAETYIQAGHSNYSGIDLTGAPRLEQIYGNHFTVHDLLPNWTIQDVDAYVKDDTLCITSPFSYHSSNYGDVYLTAAYDVESGTVTDDLLYTIEEDGSLQPLFSSIYLIITEGDYAGYHFASAYYTDIRIEKANGIMESEAWDKDQQCFVTEQFPVAISKQGDVVTVANFQGYAVAHIDLAEPDKATLRIEDLYFYGDNYTNFQPMAYDFTTNKFLANTPATGTLVDGAIQLGSWYMQNYEKQSGKGYYNGRIKKSTTIQYTNGDKICMGETLYKLTYVVDGTEVSTSELAAGATITPIAEPTKEGYTFSGWSGFPVDMKMPAHDVTITGSFTINAYKLTYIVDGTLYKEMSMNYGDKIELIAEPEKEGYIFSGWSGYPVDLLMPAHDVNITGSFEFNGIEKVIVDKDTSNTYDAMGRRTQQIGETGLYIDHGKKFMVR